MVVGGRSVLRDGAWILVPGTDMSVEPTRRSDDRKEERRKGPRLTLAGWTRYQQLLCLFVRQRSRNPACEWMLWVREVLPNNEGWKASSRIAEEQRNVS